jgi:hypothetical protein
MVEKDIMDVRSAVIGISLSCMVMQGCADSTPPPADVRIPRDGGQGYRTSEPLKPMPGQEPVSDAGGLPPPPFYDAPLVSQETPEQREFVEAYNAVGRPRMVVFVNRTLEGELLPVVSDPRDDVTVDSRDRKNGGAAQNIRHESIAAASIDYEAIETILTDWLAAGGRTEIVSPITARQRLTDEQIQDMQSGRPRMTGEIARLLDADVLEHVNAKTTRQTEQGLEIRLVAEAINVGKGGQSIGRAVVDIPPPLDKPKINKFTRYVARALMDRMIGTWQHMPAPDDRGSSNALPPTPGTQPRPEPVEPAPLPAPSDK